jgi:hypothetical protein
MRPTETIAMAKTLTLEEQPGHNDENGWATVGLIGFMDDDTFIHNPWMSPCGRFNVDPYEEYHEWDMDRFIDMTCDTHFIEMNSGADCRLIAAGVIEEILEDAKQADDDAWEGAADILDHALKGAASRGFDDIQVVRSVVLEIVSRHDPR